MFSKKRLCTLMIVASVFVAIPPAAAMPTQVCRQTTTDIHGRVITRYVLCEPGDEGDIRKPALIYYSGRAWKWICDHMPNKCTGPQGTANDGNGVRG